MAIRTGINTAENEIISRGVRMFNSVRGAPGFACDVNPPAGGLDLPE